MSQNNIFREYMIPGKGHSGQVALVAVRTIIPGGLVGSGWFLGRNIIGGPSPTHQFKNVFNPDLHHFIYDFQGSALTLVAER